ncbi:SAVED domain-containing protein [Amycolatopsis sp. NPDC059657]|uniref:SAVED domain-containing protein n=1 Tax=Amycolatopsis sp. NPDC059657 TaxID=3346899 RepID=UPI003671F6FD
MTTPTPAAGPPSRSGVRRSGDHYQDLLTWVAALRVLQPQAEFTGLEMEINGAGNVDDIVLRRQIAGDRYIQVKWTTTTSSKVDDTFLTATTGKGKSVLQKLFASYEILSSPQSPPYLELLTNRVLDIDDPLLGHVDGRTDMLVPHASSAPLGSPARRRLDEWAAHVGVPRDALLDLFSHLVFRTGLTVNSERDRAQVLMLAAGLRHDEAALGAGLALVAGWVRGGRRVLSAATLHHEVSELGLQASQPRAILLVQAIARDPHPEDADEVLDWVDLHPGQSAMSRVEPESPSHWNTMTAELDAAVARLAEAGVQDVLIRGALRQAAFFLVGARLAQVTGKRVSYVQQGVLWSSDSPRLPPPPLDVVRTDLTAGDELAVAIGIAIDPTAAVTQHIRDQLPEVSRLVTLLPQSGPHDQAIKSPGQAVGYTQAIRNTVRTELEMRPSRRIHLFLAGPGGLALLLGHRWNRLAPTTVHEHLGPGRGYTAAFTVDA